MSSVANELNKPVSTAGLAAFNKDIPTDRQTLPFVISRSQAEESEMLVGTPHPISERVIVPNGRTNLSVHASGEVTLGSHSQSNVIVLAVIDPLPTDLDEVPSADLVRLKIAAIETLQLVPEDLGGLTPSQLIRAANSAHRVASRAAFTAATNQTGL